MQKSLSCCGDCCLICELTWLESNLRVRSIYEGLQADFLLREATRSRSCHMAVTLAGVRGRLVQWRVWLSMWSSPDS